MNLIGFDIGASKIAAAIGNSSGRMTRMLVLETIRHNPQKLVDQILELFGKLQDEIKETLIHDIRIGIGICGQVNPFTGEVSSPIALGWPNAVPLAEIISDTTGMPVIIENDVNAGALGEITWGAAKGLSNVVFLSAGSGIGAGIIINGEIYRGSHFAAGEIGHMTIDHKGRKCLCGNKGCLEILAGGIYFVERVIQNLDPGITTSLNHIHKTRHSLTAKDIFREAAKGDPYCLGLVEEMSEYIAVAVVNLVNLLDPECVVLGGGLTGSGEILLPSIQKHLQQWKSCLVDCTQILLLSELVENAGVAGALAVAARGGQR